jgi:hypothetical protein
MADPTLEERLAQYGTALDGARRRGVVPERPSVARRLVPAISFVTAFAAVIAAVVLIPRDDDVPDRLRPADVAAAEAEIRDAFATWVDETATDEARREVRERLDDSAAQARADANWENAEVSYLRSEVIVDNVEFAEGDRAFVDFRLRFPNSPGDPVMVEPVPGEAVHRDGAWRVGYASICALRMGEMACNPDDFLTEEEQAIGQPFVNIAWSELPDDQRVRDIEGGSEIRDQILDSVNRHRNMLSAKTQLLAVRHRPGEKTAKVWWTVGTVQPGIAVLDGDRWTISRETWCKLSQNAGEYPPACGETAPTTTTLAQRPTTLDIQLGTGRLWPADDRLSDSSGDLEEAARRFFAALDLPDAVITAPEGASGPTWVRGEIDSTRVPVLLVPANGVWSVLKVSSGDVGAADFLFSPEDVAEWELAWHDEEGMHGSRTQGREASLPPRLIFSSIGIARNQAGEVLRVSGAWHQGPVPRPTGAAPCGANDLVISGGNSTLNPASDGDAIFVGLENHSGLACRFADVPTIELHGPSGWTRFTVREVTWPVKEDFPGDDPLTDGFFTPDLIGEVLITGRSGDRLVEYDSVRLTLPSGERLELALHLRTSGTELGVSHVQLHHPVA